MTWAIAVHGGAKTIAPEEEAANRRGCLEALEAGRAILADGGSAVDAVEAALRVLEDDPTFNAGVGSALNADGEVEMCAAIMDGATLELGAVAAIKGVRHPVSVARTMLRKKEILLAGEAARRFALEHGAEPYPPGAGMSGPGDAATRSGGHDTVGAVARDAGGNLAAATSTGGLEGSRAGRVGDSPQPGCGFYAENGAGAVALTGDGEEIARLILAGRILHRLGSGELPQAALDGLLPRIGQLGAEAGGIVLGGDGAIGWAHNSSHMAVAFLTAGMGAPKVFLAKSEERDDDG